MALFKDPTTSRVFRDTAGSPLVMIPSPTTIELPDDNDDNNDDNDDNDDDNNDNYTSKHLT